MTAPLVSVVIPAFNHARFVREAIASALAQDVSPLEVVVVDDGSTDGTREIVQGISDPRLQVHVQENHGAHVALDVGIRHSHGEYVALLNSDDRYAPGRLRRALEALRGDGGLDLAGSYITIIDADGRACGVKHGFADLDPWPVPVPGDTFKADNDLRTALLLQNYWATTSNFIMPRATYERHGPFRPLRYCHDWDFALRVQLEGRAVLLPEPLVDYRLHGTNTIRENRAAMVFEICWLMAVHVPRHVARPGFWNAGRQQRTRQLLRSVHVYGCDRVLWGMMLHLASGPPGSELALLDPSDPARRTFLDEITETLAHGHRDRPMAFKARLQRSLRGLSARIRP